jgi:SAM-dependent methyltransferase
MPAILRDKIHSLTNTLVCPGCYEDLLEIETDLCCTGCGESYKPNRYGYLEFVLNRNLYGIDSTTEEYAEDQSVAGQRFFNEYLHPWLDQEPFRRVLDVGCGVGRGISQLIREGYDAYGIDLPNLSRFWQQAGNDRGRFLACDSGRLPFPDGFFDAVYSTGVIEHIGTADGNSTLLPDYKRARQHYADEILRVTKPEGRILISCPNKNFPVDIQHGPQDDTSPEIARWRINFFNRTGVNVHPIWGKYHLLSYPETRELFCKPGGARQFEPLPLNGYFGFGRFESGFLSPIARLATAYVNHLPRIMRGGIFNPYMLVQIRR